MNKDFLLRDHNTIITPNKNLAVIEFYYVCQLLRNKPFQHFVASNDSGVFCLDPMQWLAGSLSIHW